MLLSSSNRKYPPFPLLSYFSVVMCLRCLLYHIIIFCHLLHIRSGKTGNLISSLLCSLWWVQIFGYVLACRSYSFVCTVHHLIIIIVQTYLKALNIKCLSDIFCRVCKIKHILSVIHYTICGAVCFQFTLFCCDDWENKFTLSYFHHQIGSMSYYPLFRVRSWNNGARCMSFYTLMNLWYGRIASWDIRVLVVFTSNSALCHWHAILLPCWVPYWRLTPSIYFFFGIFFRRSVSGRRVSPILLTHGDIPASGSTPPSRWLRPLTQKNKIEQGGSPLEPSEGAFELTHGSACIIWW